MRYWFDTEFIERGRFEPIKLLSIGIVADDGREFYAERFSALQTSRLSVIADSITTTIRQIRWSVNRERSGVANL